MSIVSRKKSTVVFFHKNTYPSFSPFLSLPPPPSPPHTHVFFLLHLLILLSPPPPPTVYPIFRTPFHTELFSKLTSLQDTSSLQWISGNVLGTREQREKFTTSPTQCQLSFKNVRMAANTLFDVRVVLYFVLFII